MNTFKAKLEIIGANPFVFVPDKVLKNIFKSANKDKGPIPIKGFINENAYKQTLVKYSGEWRLYINTIMLKNSPKRIGETIKIAVEYDPESREIILNAKFVAALKKNKKAKDTFEKLPASRRKEIVRYLSFLKTEESLERNIAKAIEFLHGKGRFVGRDKP